MLQNNRVGVTGSRQQWNNADGKHPSPKLPLSSGHLPYSRSPIRQHTDLNATGKDVKHRRNAGGRWSAVAYKSEGLLYAEPLGRDGFDAY
jgi:hypothetical protein